MTRTHTTHTTSARLAIIFGIIAILSMIDAAGDLREMIVPRWNVLLDLVVAVCATLGAAWHGRRYLAARRRGDERTRKAMVAMALELEDWLHQNEPVAVPRQVPVRSPEYRN